ncbi:MAG: TIR domain-containing protein [Hyphomonadaceae bacterium]
MADVFISYSRTDADAARRFAEAFEALGMSVWWDVALRSGETFDEAIEQALKQAKAVVVLWSKASIGSRWVRTEATIADRNGTLAPVMIEACERPILFELTHTADLCHWRGDTGDKAWLAFEAVVRELVAKRAGPEGAVPAKPNTPDRDARPSILVLPFVNMSGDSEQEYFADGVTEDIITDLSKIAALSVVSRNTAFTYKGKAVAVAALARDVGVSHILEGSVRKSGARVRVTAQLLDAKSDAQIWAERFDRTLDDIFAIQDEISKAIVAALQVKLAPEEKRAIEQRATASSEAYELYIMARAFSRKGSERLKPVIIRICKRVVELDPNFAPAWALISFAESELSQRGVAGSDPQRALDAAKRAIDADPNFAPGYAALAEAHLRGLAESQPIDALLERAFQLDADCYEAHLMAGSSAIPRRDYATAIHHFERAIALDEDAYWPAGMVVQAYEALGNLDDMRAAARRSLERCEKILAREPDHSGALGFFVTSLADLGETDRAREWAQRAILFDPDNARLHYNLACAMARMGDADAATDLIEPWTNSISRGWLLWMEKDNSLDPIRTHPRFAAMIARVRARFENAEPEKPKPRRRSK